MVLYKRNLFSKDAYKCGKCGGFTCPCKTCDLAFARVHEDGSQAEKDLVCSGVLKSWEQEGDFVGMKHVSFCSWCCEESEHVATELNKHVRWVYQCQSCFNRTLKCYTCKEAMAKGFFFKLNIFIFFFEKATFISKDLLFGTTIAVWIVMERTTY